MTRDLVLLNGNIMTVNPAQPRAEAIAIRNGKVAFVGSNDDARSEGGRFAQVIDLQGRTATPGLNDAHAHPMMVGRALADLNLATPPNTSISDIVALVAAEAATKPPGTWIIGRGYDQARLAEDRHPTRHDIDAVSPNHPVLLLRACHHIAAVNSYALKLAGITANTPDPDGGSIDRDEHGEPTGVVRESAMKSVRSQMEEPDAEELAEYLVRAGHAFLEAGVTSVVEAGIRRPEEMHAYQQLHNDGRLPVRTYLMMMIDETLEAMTALGIRTGFGDAMLRIGPAKLFADGSIGGHTARMSKAYEGHPGSHGLWMEPEEQMMQKVVAAHNAGFQVGIHAIGDAAISFVLDAYAAAQEVDPRPDARHRVEHFSIVDEDILRRTAELGVVALPGTSFLYHFRDAYVANLGYDRLRYAYGMATYQKYGIVAAANTDAPVVPVTATVGIQSMMTRLDNKGNATWTEECISLDDAIKAYTWNGAYCSFEENIKGSLQPGMLGDVTVFAANLETTTPTDIAAVPIDFTILEGDISYARPGANG